MINLDGLNLRPIDIQKLENIEEKLIEYNRNKKNIIALNEDCLLYTSPSPRDQRGSRMPSSA